MRRPEANETADYYFPYINLVQTDDVVSFLNEQLKETMPFLESISEEQSRHSYAPGKWTVRKILIHLAQTELALTTRARFALSQPGYQAQAFSQDDWLPLDEACDGRTALDTYTTLRRFNLAMWRKLTPDQRQRSFNHPEYGDLTVDWIMAQMAGHDIHHLKQFEMIR